MTTHIRGRFLTQRVDEASLAKREREGSWSSKAQVVNMPIWDSQGLSPHVATKLSHGFRMPRSADTILTASVAKSLRIPRLYSG